jgi:hypothetical protein
MPERQFLLLKAPARYRYLIFLEENDFCQTFVESRVLDRRTDKSLMKEIIPMQYLLLIYDTEAAWNAIGEAEQQQIYRQYMELTQDLQKNGKCKSSNQLQPVSTAATVRIRNGKKTVTDGPFAETKEQLGGYYLVEAKDREEALAIAARIPSARLGCVEVRPIVMR